MNQQENALVIFAEELGEVATELLDLQKQLFKALRFGIDEQRDLPTSNRQRMNAEWNDLLAAVEKLRKHGIHLSPDLDAICRKLDKIDKYNAYAESLGTLEPARKA
ncbi:MAG: hypothetical protein K2X64_05520 [Rhodocyclaceae bacterium]|nr:hypothetical protein [Rhodocyclaceae bacterium]